MENALLQQLVHIVRKNVYKEKCKFTWDLFTRIFGYVRVCKSICDLKAYEVHLAFAEAAIARYMDDEDMWVKLVEDFVKPFIEHVNRLEPVKAHPVFKIPSSLCNLNILAYLLYRGSNDTCMLQRFLFLNGLLSHPQEQKVFFEITKMLEKLVVLHSYVFDPDIEEDEIVKLVAMLNAEVNAAVYSIWVLWSDEI